MRLLRLRVERFRGVRSLDWTVPDRLVCLVGAGDTGKSTILEAVALSAWPRTTASFTDNDFFGGNPVDGLRIEATFTDLPAGHGLLAESRFGLLLGGVDTGGGLHDEPGDHEPTITVRLDVDSALEPTWRVVTSADPDGRVIAARDRAALSVAIIGATPDRQFTWARGSALARAAGEDVAAILLEAHRQAHDAVAAVDLTGLDQAVEAARTAGTRMGVGVAADDLAVGLDLTRATGAALALQAGGIPVAASGLGTRRLFALGLELLASPTGGIACLDEIESGLEPHRLRHLMAALTEAAHKGHGQVLFTSHSPTVIEQLGARYLYIVRNDNGAATITQVPDDLTPVVRANAAALLSRRVVVAEGKTEIGLVRGHDANWAAQHSGQSLAFVGVAVVDGGGAQAARRALSLHGLGYPTLLFADSDQPLNPTADDLRARGIEVVQWPDGMCTEQRLATDLSWAALVTLFSRLPDIGLDPQACLANMLATDPGKQQLAALGKRPVEVGDTLDALLSAGFDETIVRQCFWRAATSKSGRGWFKLIDSGHVLGEVAAADAPLHRTPAGQALDAVAAWCYHRD